MNPYRVAEAQKLLAKWAANPLRAERYPLYGSYLESLAKAERLNAVHKYLRPLLVQLAAKSHLERLELVSALCFAVDFSGKTPGSSPVPGMPYDFLEQIALPTLLAQRADAPDDAYAHLWLAMLPSRRWIPELPERHELLDAALKLAPTDPYIAERRVDALMNSIWFSCHHLPEVLLSSEGGFRQEVSSVRSLLPLLQEERTRVLSGQLSEYEQQVNKYVKAKLGKNDA